MRLQFDRVSKYKLRCLLPFTIDFNFEFNVQYMNASKHKLLYFCVWKHGKIDIDVAYELSRT